MLYRKVKNGIQCILCPHECIIQEGKTGICGVRANINGKIENIISGIISGYAVDPIEKKPLYHFYPSKNILSVGSFGCNLKCNFCQNWQISQDVNIDNISGITKTPEEIVAEALKIPNNIGIAYTYNEPTIWFEFMHQTASLAKSKDLKNVMVSNGFINPEPLELLIGVIDAFNIDLKGFSEDFYHEMTRSKLSPILKTLKIINNYNKHLELTFLAIPRKNDNLELFAEMINWIYNELNENTVLHISRYFPRYKQTLPPTPENTLIEMYNIAKEKLNYVYLGNINKPEYSDTYCPVCNKKLIIRNGYSTEFTQYYTSCKCLNCNTTLPF